MEKKETNPCICGLKGNYFSFKDRHELRLKKWTKVFQSKGPESKQISTKNINSQRPNTSLLNDECVKEEVKI